MCPAASGQVDSHVKEIAWMLVGASCACLTLAGVEIMTRRKPGETGDYPLGIGGVSSTHGFAPANDAEHVLKNDWRDDPIAPGFGR
jgi:hypothetical protein